MKKIVNILALSLTIVLIGVQLSTACIYAKESHTIVIKRTNNSIIYNDQPLQDIKN